MAGVRKRERANGRGDGKATAEAWLGSKKSSGLAMTGNHSHKIRFDSTRNVPRKDAPRKTRNSSRGGKHGGILTYAHWCDYMCKRTLQPSICNNVLIILKFWRFNAQHMYLMDYDLMLPYLASIDGLGSISLQASPSRAAEYRCMHNYSQGGV